jgi:hypothetical protein
MVAHFYFSRIQLVLIARNKEILSAFNYNIQNIMLPSSVKYAQFQQINKNYVPAFYLCIYWNVRPCE